ncbi:MAG: hypothetical protein WAZ63_16120, partial [Rhodoferax sp.]|uniref:hypothetical protein n=1 Tax=Rhodoferax sp. TaxID=50421 RepID=UPI003BB6EEC4
RVQVALTLLLWVTCNGRSDYQALGANCCVERCVLEQLQAQFGVDRTQVGFGKISVVLGYHF